MPLIRHRALDALAVAAVAAAMFFAAPAQAGDPCPIDFTFHDLGAPQWLDRDALLDGLTSKDSWVGISFSTHSDGVRVDAVSDGGPAAKAGLRVGQHIVSADGAKVATHGALGERFRQAKPGSTVSLGLADGGTVALTLGRQDPVLGALIDHAARQDCAFVRRGDVAADRVEALRSKVFHENRRFRCEDAHLQFEGLLQPGDVVMVRGSKRVLLANPGWATVCIRAAEVDGDHLAKAIPGLFERLSKAYVTDRYDNP